MVFIDATKVIETGSGASNLNAILMGGGAHLHGSAGGSEKAFGFNRRSSHLRPSSHTSRSHGPLRVANLGPLTPLTDSNFQTAVNLWFSDEANATATYGHILVDWNVSAVTDMSNAFMNRTTFNEDITQWDASTA